MPQIRFLLVMILSAGLIAPAAAGESGNAASVTPEVGALFDLMEERIALMPGVAAWKWRRGIAIEDKAREAAVIDAAVEAAVREGLDPRAMRFFLEAQIEAAKSVQVGLFQEWTESGFPGEIPDRDLDSDLRPAIGTIGAHLPRRLRAALPALADPRRAGAQRVALLTRLAPYGVPGPTVDYLLAAMRGVARAGPAGTSTLDRVLEMKTLRIGTTGDYPPFSARQGDTVAGIDIDLARRLAASLDAEAVFIPTTWPTLLDDLGAGRFDIAMGGISRKLFRQRIGYLSAPYHTGGKTPIARCDDVDRFASLAAIDRPGVTVIVNPGGTNERFVRDRITQATVRIFDDNTAIFDEIAAGRADVMVTDAIEVAYRAGRDPRLCPTMPGRTLTFSQKAYLMPRDEAWARYVDAWLAEVTGDGTLAAIFERHLNAQE